MKSKRAISLLTTFAVALTLTVATAVGQQAVPPIGPAQVPVLPRGRFEAIQVPPRPTANFYFTTDAQSPDRATFDNAAEEENLKAQTREQILALESQKAGSSENDAVKAKLIDFLGKQFDMRQTRHKHQIETLETEVKKLKELVKKREENRADIISRKLEQIVRESQGLGF